MSLSAFDGDESVEELIESERFKEASVLLKTRITDGPVELKDILLLGKIYEGLNLNKKAIKIYLYGIRKLHSPSWKQIKSYKKLIISLPELKIPPREALLLAYKVAVHYYDLFITSESSEEFNNRILDTSMKYFTICKYFNFNPPKTSYYLGLIYKEFEDYGKASLSFLNSWKIFNLQMRKDRERDQKIRLMIGESFVNYGHVDPGTAYLRTVYYGRASNPYLRNYASEYLDEFLGTSVGGGVGFSVGSDSNVLFGNATGNEAVKASSFTSKNASIFLGHSPSYSNSYNFSLSFSEELHTETVLKDYDSRSLSFTSSWDYKKIDHNIIYLSYFLSKAYARASNVEEFDPESTSHQFVITWKKTLKKGVISLYLPFSRTIFDDGSQNDSRGLGSSYEDINFGAYWNPNYSVEVSAVEEDEGFEESRNIFLRFSNALFFSELLSGTVDFSYESNSNSDDSLSYVERVLGFSMLYSIEKIDGLDLELEVSSEANTPSSGTSDTRLKTVLGVSYLL